MQRCDLVCHEEREQQHSGLQGFGNPSTRPRLQLSLVILGTLCSDKRKEKSIFPSNFVMCHSCIGRNYSLALHWFIPISACYYYWSYAML